MTNPDAVHCSQKFQAGCNTYDPEGLCDGAEGCTCKCPYCYAWWYEYGRDLADDGTAESYERSRGMDKDDH